MTTTPTRTSGPVLDETWRHGDLPPLTSLDRVALRLGLALILWGQRHAERTERDEHARRSRATERAARSRDLAFEHRSHAGPTW